MSVAAEKARGLRAAQLAKRREAERADAWDFLVFGDDDKRHAKWCVHAQACTHDGSCQREVCQPCSRTYDPLPSPRDGGGAAPEPARFYAGTGVGALYGLPGSEQHLWQLAGWNVAIPERDGHGD